MKYNFLFAALFLYPIVYAQNDDPNYIIYRGIVINEQGQPIQGAVIDIYNCTQNQHLPRIVTHAGSVTTNAEGRFSFSRYKAAYEQIEYSTAFVRAEGYALKPENYSIWDDFQQIILSSKTADFEGRVVDSQQQPVPGAMVHLFLSNVLAVAGVPALSCKTDAKGQFTITGLSTMAKAEFYVTKTGYADYYTFRTDQSWPEHQYTAGRRDILLSIRKEASLSGQLLRSDTKAPLTKETVSIIRDQGQGARLYTYNVLNDVITPARTYTLTDSYTVQTDSEGRFFLDHLIPGRHTVFHHNYVTGLFTPRSSIAVEEGVQKDIVIESVPGEKVVIQAAYEHQAPIPTDVRITLDRQAEQAEPVYEAFWKQPGQSGPDPDGCFRFILLPGRYKARVASKTVDGVGEQPVFDVPTSVYPVLSLKAKETRPQQTLLQGTCRDADGQVVAGAKVFLLSDPNNAVTSGLDGRFALTPRLEECRKNVWWKYRENKKRYEENPSWGEIGLAAEYGPFNQDEETDWMGIPAYLVARSPEDNSIGTYEFYSHRDLQRWKGPFDLVLQPACSLAGTVVDKQDQPIPSAKIDIVMTDGNFEPQVLYQKTVTDAQGQFTVPGLRMKTNYQVIVSTGPGTCLIKHFSADLTQHPGYEGVQHIYVKQAGPVDMGTFMLDSSTYQVSGIVTDHLGRPVTHARLTLNAFSQGIRNVRFFTKEDGRFVFDDLLSGAILLRCNVGKNGYAAFETTAGTKDIRLIIPGSVAGNEGGSPIPSAAVEMTFYDQQTGQRIISPNSAVKLLPENGNPFSLKLNDQGSVRFLIGAGMHRVEFSQTDKIYKQLKSEFTSELYQVYQHDYFAEPTEKKLALDQVETIIYPEIFSEKTNTWNPKMATRTSDEYGLLEIAVVEESTRTPVANAEVLISFDGGKGRLLGSTGEDGKVTFAVFYDTNNCTMMSLKAPGYVESRPDKYIITDARNISRQTFEMNPIPESPVVWPQVLSDASGQWKTTSLSNYNLLEIRIRDLETEMPVPQAAVHILFSKERGRFEGTADNDGKVFFAVPPDVDRCMVTSVSAPSYQQRQFNKEIRTRYSDARNYEFVLVQDPVTVNVTVLDLNGNPAPKVWLYHDYYKMGKWERVTGGGNGPTDENGRAQIAWLREPCTPPTLEHFLYAHEDYAVRKVFIANVVTAMPDDEITLQMIPPIQVQGRLVDAEGNGIAGQGFNFHYMLKGQTITGPHAKTRQDGGFGPLSLAPGFDYEIHINRDRIGTFGENAAVHIDGHQPVIQLPDCIFLN